MVTSENIIRSWCFDPGNVLKGCKASCLIQRYDLIIQLTVKAGKFITINQDRIGHFCSPGFLLLPPPKRGGTAECGAAGCLPPALRRPGGAVHGIPWTSGR